MVHTFTLGRQNTNKSPVKTWRTPSPQASTANRPHGAHVHVWPNTIIKRRSQDLGQHACNVNRRNNEINEIGTQRKKTRHRFGCSVGVRSPTSCGGSPHEQRGQVVRGGADVGESLGDALRRPVRRSLNLLVHLHRRRPRKLRRA